LIEEYSQQSAAQNIGANAICPYFAETPLLKAAPVALHQALIDGTPSKRLARAEEVAKAFIFFASDDASYGWLRNGLGELL